MNIGVHAAAHVAGSYDLKAIFGGTAPRRLDRLSEMALAASGIAFQSAAQRAPRFSVPFDDARAVKGGVFFATGQGNFSGTMSFLEKMRDKGARFANPIDFPNLVMSACAGSLSMQFQLKGEILSLTQQRLAGLQAICFAAEAILGKRLDTALAAGAEEHSAARTRCAELLGSGPLDEGAAALVLGSPEGAPVRLTRAILTGPQVSLDALLQRCLDGSGIASAEVVSAPGRGELDVGGLIDAAHAYARIARGELRHAVCLARGPEGGAAILLEAGTT